MKCYYAHCMAIYGSEQERCDLSLLERIGFEVYNPNCEEAQGKYAEYKESRGDGMIYFLEIVEENDILAFRANPDGSIPAGVASEIDHAFTMGLLVIELPSGIQARTLSICETAEWLEQCGQR